MTRQERQERIDAVFEGARATQMAFDRAIAEGRIRREEIGDWLYLGHSQGFDQFKYCDTSQYPRLTKTGATPPPKEGRT